MKNCGVYAFVNLLDGSRYVGQSLDIDKRRKDHLSRLRAGKHSNRRFQRAFSRDGEAAFAFVVLCHCRPADLNSAEQYYLADMRGLYNFSPVAQANGAGKRDKEARANIAAAVRAARVADPAITERQAASLRAAYLANPELRILAAKGSTGRVHSEGERVRRSISVKAAKSSPEHRALVSENSHRVWSDPAFREKHKAAMSNAMTADVLAARREAIKKSKAEKFADPEYRAAISAKLKAAWAKRKQAALIGAKT